MSETPLDVFELQTLMRAAKIADRVVLAYMNNRSEVATICDEQLDRSGNLLGWIRELAAVYESKTRAKS